MTPDPPPLPPALARLVAGLRLSSGFTLSFVTGPRDHRDSVFLRLARELQREFDLVRHRLDRDGLQFFDVLSGQADERPRLVFVSGLENMSEEDRRETIARLNLVRDSWAPHPARVVFWLPSWGLREFRDLAPDLFDWRSNLTVLHDADLPVRDELELLVWTCERHRLGRTRSRWDLFRSRQHSDAVLLTLADVLATSRRALLLGPDASELGPSLRRAAFVGAAERLQERYRRGPAWISGQQVDLDVLRTRSHFRFTPRATVFVTAVEAAGCLDASEGWASLARACGLPGAPDGAGVLSTSACAGDLRVVFDRLDLLDMSNGTPADRWWTWLTEEHPHLQACAALTELPDKPLPGWDIYDIEPSTPPASDASAKKALADLLVDLFSPQELRSWVVFWFGDEFAAKLLADRPGDGFSTSFVEAAELRGLLDASFFAELRGIRLRFADRIDAIARSYLSTHESGAQDMP